MKTWILMLALAVTGGAMVATDVEAKRLGGARSTGAQRSVAPAPPSSVPAKPGQASQMNQTSQAAPAAAPAAPASGLSRWAPMLGGLAIGGLLGSLFGGSALGGAIMAALMVGLLAFAGFFVFRMLTARKAEAAPRPMQYAAMGAETVAAPPPSQLSGFDRGAAPAAVSANIPAGFDVAGFVRGAKMNFLKLQAANDAGHLEDLREFSTPEMFAELEKDLAARGGAKQQTDVVALNADLLEVATEGGTHWATLRFSGMIRESAGQAPEGFEEVWTLSKPADGSAGWVLAGIQQMQ